MLVYACFILKVWYWFAEAEHCKEAGGGGRIRGQCWTRGGGHYEVMCVEGMGGGHFSALNSTLLKVKTCLVALSIQILLP